MLLSLCNFKLKNVLLRVNITFPLCQYLSLFFFSVYVMIFTHGDAKEKVRNPNGQETLSLYLK